jgi:hypothetical protein
LDLNKILRQEKNFWSGIRTLPIQIQITQNSGLASFSISCDQMMIKEGLLMLPTPTPAIPTV